MSTTRTRKLQLEGGSIPFDGVYNAGTKALGVLRLASAVSNTETVTIGSDTYEFSTDGAVTSGRILVDVTADQGASAAGTALVAAINASGTEPVTALKVSANEVIVYGDEAIAQTTALSETLAGSNNAWDTAAMRVGTRQSFVNQAVVARVPNATEVALGNLHIPLDFAPTHAIVQIRVTSTGVEKAWDGAVTLDATNYKVTLDNTGSTDWAATDTVTVLVMG